MKVGCVSACLVISRRVGSNSFTATLLASFLVGAAAKVDISVSENNVVVYNCMNSGYILLWLYYIKS